MKNWTETIERYLREGRSVSGGHHGKSGQQKQAEGASANDLAQQKSLTGAAQGTLGQFEGPIQNSPFYKAMLTSGIEGTSNAYNNARSNMRQRASQSGFGYSQPVEQGGENQLDAREATSLAAQPREAMMATAPLALSAADESGRMGMEYGSQAEGFNNDAYRMNKGRGGLWSALQGIASTAAQGIGSYYGAQNG